MDGFVQWMEKHFMPKASVIAAQRHLVAIRDAFVVTMPLMILGALAVLININCQIKLDNSSLHM